MMKLEHYGSWPFIDKEIENMILICKECVNATPNHPKSELTPWKWLQIQWTRIQSDFFL